MCSWTSRKDGAQYGAGKAGDDADYPDTWAIWQEKIGASVISQTVYTTVVGPALEKDLGGAARKNGTIDRGAYEY
jgi:hypothetical protein